MNPATALSETLRRIRLRWRGSEWQRIPAGSEPPLRAELFGADQMEEHGRALATAHRLTAQRGADRLLSRLAANEEALVGICKGLTAAVGEKNRITPAGEWLLDNFYLIEEQIRTAKRHLPKGYSRKLPRLAAASSSAGAAGPPRVYDMALEIVAHGDGHIDINVLSRFIAAYQSVAALTLGELWATPIMLRLAVIENLRRVGVRIASARREHALADTWADRLTQTAEREPKNLILAIADMARSQPPMVSAFVAELARRLHGQGPALALPLTWLEQQLAESGQTIEQLIQLENQQQASDQVSVSNSIGSLRLLGAINWREFVEALSVVEVTLREDPAAAYARMDFATRDRYRHATERIASRHPHAQADADAEAQVAREAVALARAAAAGEGVGASRRGHVGFYLVGAGVGELEAALNCPPGFVGRCRRQAARFPLLLYLSPVVVMAAGVAVLMLTKMGGAGLSTLVGPAAPAYAVYAVQALIGLIWLIAASQTAVALVNWFASLIVPAQIVPRMDFSEGIPPECRTLVVIPTMLTSEEGVARLVEALEVRFLANRDRRLHFALLTDFCDADAASLPGDDALVELAREGIEALNRKYDGGVDEVWDGIFFLFHRARRWNAQERVWMGYERKRGKLAALNALLRGERADGVDDDFALVVGDVAVLSYVRYVITLDTDTQLPRDSARQFVGAMAHPLNRPEYDAQKRRVVEGYGLLQPRVDVSLPAANRSRYARLYGGEPGIDPYTRAVSETYQDVFGEGSFIGKGIYDVDAFEEALGARFPENLILSHDLIEGCYVRSGLLSDVSLFEAYPASYLADTARRRRWIRGDWQIAGWLLPRVPGGPRGLAQGGAEAGAAQVERAARATRTAVKPPLEKNTLSLVSQWKIFDNLRRSLVAAAICLLFVIAWTLPGASLSLVLFLTLATLALVFVPALVAIAVDFLRWPPEALVRQQLAALGRSSARRLLQVVFELSCLPHEAAYSLAAIAKTLWRLLIARKGLLEWNPAGEAERANAAVSGTLGAFVREMAAAPALALALAAYLASARPAILVVAAPVLLLWFFAPLFAWALSRPLVPRRAQLSARQTIFLRRTARRIWSYFETFVNADDNWLPPDNYQKYRIAAVAHRTSPTNIGLSLLANLAAYDFGYVPAGQLIERTTRSFGTMARLGRERGHFYNWYDTKSLQPLLPLYVSTVDSGNLAGHLLVLRAGLAALPDDRIFRQAFFAGLSDTLAVLEDVASEVAVRGYRGDIAEFRKALALAAFPPAASLEQLRALLVTLAGRAESLAASAHENLLEAATAPAAVSSPAGEGGVAAARRLAQRVSVASEAGSTLESDDGRSSQGKSSEGKSSDGKGSDVIAADLVEWARALADECAAALAELDVAAPWLALPPPPAGALLAAEAQALTAIPTWRELARESETLAASIALRLSADAPGQAGEAGGDNLSAAPAANARAWLAELERCLGEARTRSLTLIGACEALSRQAGEYAEADYEFLFDRSGQLLAIGYNASEHRRDASYYDLLASEARLASFVAIAQGQLPQDNWFSLGRMLTNPGGEPVLLSWSGSMFEYLMPLLVMPGFDDTLLDQTCKAAVDLQIGYGAERAVPWGMSESGYNTVDAHFNYQYRAFGVPGLGLQRGLADDLVVAPYASLLALTVAPEAACRNLQRLEAEGFSGRFGFFEAIDYTPARQRRGQSRTLVLSYMAHHQAMSLLALACLLLDRPMQRRFSADPQFQAVMPLLQERIPKPSAIFPRKLQISAVRSSSSLAETPIRVFTSPDTLAPEVQLLSNGRYHVMVSNAGGGYSRWKDLAVTRWREDATRDFWGTFCYLRELPIAGAGGKVDGAPAFWSTAYQPTLRRPESYEAIFSEGRAEFRRRDAVAAFGAGASEGGAAGNGYFETHTEIVVSPEDDIELRRMRITNRSRHRRDIEVTSYAEVVIAPAASDSLHPVFSNLFVQTEVIGERNAILCTRRPRAHDETPPWMLHLLVVRGAQSSEVSYETDRLRFIGRGRTSAAPQAMLAAGPLSGSAGPVLDPIVAIRHRIGLDPEQSVTVDMVTGIADKREAALALVTKFQDQHLADRVFDLAWTHSQVVLRQLNASEADAQLYARLAGAVLYANASWRPDAALLMKNRRSQSALWAYAISGDLPIVLLRIGDAANIGLVRQLVEAHAYWRMKGLAVDLVIWNEDPASYRQRLQDEIVGLIASGMEASVIDRPGGIFVRLAELISGDDRILFQSVARAVISDGRGTLAEQLAERKLSEAHPPRLRARRSLLPFAASGESPVAASAREAPPAVSRQEDRPGTAPGNGIGAFSADGREYVITLPAGTVTPAPWVNVIANAQFGTVVSESGGAYTFSENAHEFRLTPWHNDPVSDASGEAIYLRDEESGVFWSPTPLPAPAPGTCTIRHGFGYSVFERREGGIFSELTIYLALDAPIKFSRLVVRNESGRPRQLSATSYVEWVLGDLRAKSALHVSSEIDSQSGALFARNAYSAEFPDRVAFLDVDDPARSLTADRAEFIGRNGSLASPAAMKRVRLSGRVGAGFDPCAAMQLRFDLAAGESREIVFRLGAAASTDAAVNLAQRWRSAFAARAVLQDVREHWQRLLGTVRIETPDATLNALANGWLVYQTLACRLWARSGYYQSGGAFGFRDQLQDAMALTHAAPQILRAQLLRCASRQFVEGDVQHWWHPPAGRGVRTRCSDDYLWLPLAISRYVVATGDTGVLDETAPFLEGRPVSAGDESYYDLPGIAVETASLYEHGVRAIRNGLTFGTHGLPLIGSGDWNDGMNRVGIEGRGESVWLAFFLCEVLRQFAEIAEHRGDTAFAGECREQATRLRANVEANAWDGEWYRRAYFDDGQPLGSKDNVDCRIDSIAQSWSVLSAVDVPGAELARPKAAMQALDDKLVKRDAKIVLLLDPPFDKADFDPGYIRGYLPGVRENGGQYTHAAVWAAMAFAALGQTDKAWEVLDLINPARHAESAEALAVYKVEPYVIAADVYALPPHTGRGGWSWYTGSAGWTYRLIVESLLGLRREGGKLRLNPRLPTAWPGVAIDYRYRDTLYRIRVRRSEAGDRPDQATGMRVSVDGAAQESNLIALTDDGREHAVEVELA